MALQTYIQAAYTLEFNARIPHFLPCLLGLYRADGVLVGACGLNQACHGEHEQPLYLEQYLEQPVEAAIETRLGVRPARHRIIEVGNLACSEPGHARLMFAALCRLLCDNSLDYVVFTGTAKLRNSFTRLRLNRWSWPRPGPSGGRGCQCLGRILPLPAQGDGRRHQPGREVLAQSSLLLNLLGPMPRLF